MDFDEKLSPSAQGYVAVNPCVMGPFSIFCKCSGLNLNNCKLRKSRSWPFSVIQALFAVLLIVLFSIKFIFTITAEYPPLTAKWAAANMEVGMFGFSICSAICVLLWTKTGFIQSFEEQLGRLKALRFARDDSIDTYRKDHIRMVIFGALFMIGFVCTAFKHIFYETMLSEKTRGYHMNLFTMFGIEPIVTIYMGIACLVALSIYYLVHLHLLREITYFNEELQKASRAQQLMIPEIFTSFAKRHLSITLLIKHTNMHLGKLTGFGSILLCLPIANSVFITISYIKLVSPIFLIELFSFNIFGMILMAQLLGAPGKVREGIDQTIGILLDDDTIILATDEKIIHTFRMFSERCAKCTPMTAGTFVITNQLMKRVMLFVPNIGCFLAFLHKLINEA
ncbi:unnamed protein product [Auanema sp. JU1783]|nr:unnamed protein product [Auanema sp. JU1783]